MNQPHIVSHSQQTIAKTTNIIADSLNKNITNSFHVQKQISASTGKLIENIAQMKKQTKDWFTLVESLNNSLKELGDFENWADLIVEDMKSVHEKLA